MELRGQGLSLSNIARQTGTTVAVVRRIVGPLNTEVEAGKRAQQEAIARRIDAEPISYKEKVAKWTAETGQSGVTFWRVLNRIRGKADGKR